MVSNSAQLDRRTKQHTQFGVSASNGSRDMGRTKSWRKKKEKKRKKKKEKKNERSQFHIASPTGIANYKKTEKYGWYNGQIIHITKITVYMKKGINIRSISWESITGRIKLLHL